MKRIHIIVLLMAAVTGSFFLPGCTKNFLEKPRGGDVTIDTIFRTQKQANYAVAQMYNLCIKTYFAQNNSGDSRPEVVTDQLYIINPAYNWAQLSMNAGVYVTGNMSPSATIDKGGFGSHYQGIRQANLVLQNIDKVEDADAAWKADVKAQALFCRALQHYEVFRLYGGIPIVTVPLDGEDNLKIPRSSLKNTVDNIVAWCDEAAAILPATRASVDYGKVTKLAALALKARVLLYAASPLYNTPQSMASTISAARFGDGRDSVLCYPAYDQNRWQLAAAAAKAVIDNAGASSVSLYNTGKPETIGTNGTYAELGDYEAVYNVYANQELILVNTYNQVTTGFEWGRYLMSKVRLNEWGAKNNVPVEFMQQYEKRNGTTWTLPTSGDDFGVDVKALNLDPRFYQTIAYDGQTWNSSRGVLAYYKAGDGYAAGSLSSSDAGPDGYAMEAVKFVARIDNMSDNHFAWPVFRLAEFYLSYAEALNEMGAPTTEAYQYLNAIRSRAGMPSKTGLSQDQFRLAVQNERTIELAYEGHRYNDLNRWLKAHIVLNQPLRGVSTTAKKVNNTLKRSWQIVPFIQRVFPIKYYYVPFPYSEVSKQYLGNATWNGQNPGW